MATTPVSSSSTTTGTTMTAAQISAANKANAQKILTSLSAGSGVDVASLAQNLVNAEKVPQENAINAKISKNENKISGLSAVMFMMTEFKTALTAVKDRDNFNTLTVANSNTAAVSVTATAAASVGDHQIVVNALSQPQRSISLGFSSSTASINAGSSFGLTIAGNSNASVGTSQSYSTYMASINAPSFATTPSVNDFKSFSIDIDGKTIQLTPAPATASMADLASNLQTQLRALDGSSDLSVTYNGSQLEFTSATTTRVVNNPALSSATTIQLDNGAFQDSPIFSNVMSGVHLITVRDKNGCGSTTIQAVVINYPKYFTPNGDGYHDTWNITNLSNQPGAVITIFDRYGKVLTQVKPNSNGWDGTYNGNLMPSDDYWFSVNYTDENQVSQEFRAHFAMKR